MGIPMSNKRSVALLGHGGAGKTMVAEAMLNIAGATSRMGSVEEGNTASDHHPEEIKRRYSIYSAVLPMDYKDHRVTVVDCPGYLDFVGESISALSVVDGAVIVVNGVSGIEPQTRLAWQNCQRFNTPRMFFVSLLDKENSSFSRVLGDLRKTFGNSVAPVVIPIGEQSSLKGTVNILLKKALVRDGDKIVEQEVPADMQAAVDSARAELVESIVELDDALMERYMADEPISDDELLGMLREGASKGKICPVVAGAGKQKVGVTNLLNMIISSMPGPAARGKVEGEKLAGGPDSRPISEDAPFSARVFKITSEGQLGDVVWFRVYSGVVRPGDSVFNPRTSENEKISTLLVMRGKAREDLTQAAAGDIAATVKLKGARIGDTLCAKDNAILYPAVQYPNAVAFEAVHVDDKNDLEKCIATLHQYEVMDPTLRIIQDEETKELVLHGMGQLHIDVTAAAVKNKVGVQLKFEKPRIPYRETITMKAECQGKYKKQTGGRGKYGDAHIRLEPRERGEGFEFVDAVVGGVVPNRFIPAVEKGIIDVMHNGPMSGSRVIDVRATLFFGSSHPVDSDELSFKMAGALGFKGAFEKAGPIILEPIYSVKVHTPDEYTGDVMGDLNTRRGRVAGMDQEGGLRVITAQVPLAELYQYINTLRSITQGQGYFDMEFSTYEQVPGNVQNEIVKHYQATRKAVDED